MTYQSQRLIQRLRHLKAQAAEWEREQSRLLVDAPFCPREYVSNMFGKRYSQAMIAVHLDACARALQLLLTEIHSVEARLEALQPERVIQLSDEALRVIHDMRPPNELPDWAPQAMQKRDLPGFEPGPRAKKAEAKAKTKAKTKAVS